jgi:hypothetical protein
MLFSCSAFFEICCCAVCCVALFLSLFALHITSLFLHRAASHHTTPHQTPLRIAPHQASCRTTLAGSSTRGWGLLRSVASQKGGIRASLTQPASSSRGSVAFAVEGLELHMLPGGSGSSKKAGIGTKRIELEACDEQVM